jgi:spore maturation protein CgeB
MRNKYFIEYFGHDKLQPMRNVLIENQNKLQNYIDFMTNNLYSKELNSFNKNSNNILHLFKNNLSYLVGDFYRFLHLLYIYIFNPNINTKKNENEYYKIDIVEKYNQYKMFIVPEEVIDLPAIGFVEGMACGAAYIGLRNSMYEDIGMKDKEHYIGYDGTIEDLIEKISYYQLHDDELRKIANKGYEFVANNLNVDSIMTNFFNSLQIFISKSNHIK